MPQLRSEPGVLSFHVGHPTAASPDEYVVITTWRDLDALRGFAGDRWDQR